MTKEITSELKQIHDACTLKVKGKIAAYHLSGQIRTGISAQTKGTWYYPIYVYEVDGKEYKIVSPHPYTEKERSKFFRRGTVMTIMVNPDNPHQAYVPKEEKLRNSGKSCLGN